MRINRSWNKYIMLHLLWWNLQNLRRTGHWQSHYSCRATKSLPFCTINGSDLFFFLKKWGNFIQNMEFKNDTKFQSYNKALAERWFNLVAWKQMKSNLIKHWEKACENLEMNKDSKFSVDLLVSWWVPRLCSNTSCLLSCNFT